MSHGKYSEAIEIIILLNSRTDITFLVDLKE